MLTRGNNFKVESNIIPQEAIAFLLYQASKDCLLLLFCKYIPELCLQYPSDDRMDALNIIHTLGLLLLKRPDCVEGIYWQGAVACLLELCLGSNTASGDFVL